MWEKRLRMFNSHGWGRHPCHKNMSPMSKTELFKRKGKDEPWQEVGKFSSVAFLSFHATVPSTRALSTKEERSRVQTMEMGKEDKESLRTCEAALLCHLNRERIQSSFTGYSKHKKNSAVIQNIQKILALHYCFWKIWSVKDTSALISLPWDGKKRKKEMFLLDCVLN